MKLDLTYRHVDGTTLRAYTIPGTEYANELEVMLFVKNGELVYAPPLQVKTHAIESNKVSVGATKWVVGLINALLMDLE